jgi:exodeoxyribonuclease VII small subunit
MPTKSPTAKFTEENFENAMARLEAIVEQMESDKLPLEDLLTRYEEGVKLVKVCEDKLSAAEKRIEIITRNAAGEPEIEEFESAKKPAVAPRDEVSLF